MDPITIGLLGAQAAIGGAQFLAGVAKSRKKIDTEIQPEYKQAEEAARNASQSTSASYALARQSSASEGATARMAAARSAQNPLQLMRAQQQISRGQQSSMASLYQSELREKSSELRDLGMAKIRTAGARERMQSLKNELAMRENAARDQLISSGMRNVFGALQSGAYFNNLPNMQSDPFGDGLTDAQRLMGAPGYRTQVDLMRRQNR